jgi:hypothetical protein
MDWGVFLIMILDAIREAIENKGTEKTRACLLGPRRNRLFILDVIKEKMDPREFRQNRREIYREVLGKLDAAAVNSLMAQAAD